jgi:dTDP-4-dehydrorhamnose 3,5-epimerase
MNHSDLSFLSNRNFTQINESYSKKSVFRGLHFQWNPFMDKLIRCITGKIIDFALDIRFDSPTFGKIITHTLTSDILNDTSEWLWVPSGFAHGFYANENSIVEYLCTGQWSPGNEYTINIQDNDIDWTLCDAETTSEFNDLLSKNMLIISDKDRAGASLEAWYNHPKSKLFTYED